jgi:hypothetical protein
MIAGGPYTVTASAAGVATAAGFALTNTPLYTISPQFVTTKPYNSGSTIAIKIKVLNGQGQNVGSPSLALTAVSVVPPGGGLISPGNSQPGNLFTFDPESGTYQFNLKTTGYKKGTYTLNFTVGNDPTTYSVQFVIG